jgi:DNA polymerase/3'-5' exonuclease PolX
MKYPYAHALQIAEEVKAQLAPHCDKIEIAGSIRRKKEFVKDIEIVAIPKPYETGLFKTGLAEVVDQWTCVKGELEYMGRPGVKPCRYTQRILPSGIALDLFFAKPKNWGWILALRTGSDKFNRFVLLEALKQKGYAAMGGYIRYRGAVEPVTSEMDLFRLCNLPYSPPEARNL